MATLDARDGLREVLTALEDLVAGLQRENVQLRVERDEARLAAERALAALAGTGRLQQLRVKGECTDRRKPGGPRKVSSAQLAATAHLSPAEAGLVLGVTQTTVYRWRQREQQAPRKFGMIGAVK